MREFDDDEMRSAIAGTQPYTVVILKAGPNYGAADAPDVIWEHGRRNLGLRDAGTLAVVLPVTDESGVCGIGVFNVPVAETEAIMADDPGVRAGVFTFDVHPCRGFPGDHLP